MRRNELKAMRLMAEVGSADGCPVNDACEACPFYTSCGRMDKVKKGSHLSFQAPTPRGRERRRAA